MKTGPKGLALIKRFEGLRLKAYLCPAGVPTIGYGSTGRHVKLGMQITAAQAEDMLRADLQRFEAAVNRLVKVPLSQEQFDALVSFAFNCGEGALQKSTLLKRLNAGAHHAVPHELMRWNRAGGKVLQGLTNRRQAEAALWNSASGGTIPAPPDIEPIPSTKQPPAQTGAQIALGIFGALAAAAAYFFTRG